MFGFHRHRHRRVIKHVSIGWLMSSILYGLSCLRQTPSSSSSNSESASATGKITESENMEGSGRAKSVSFLGGLIQLDDVESEGTAKGYLRAKGSASGSWQYSTTSSSGQSTSGGGSGAWTSSSTEM